MPFARRLILSLALSLLVAGSAQAQEPVSRYRWTYYGSPATPISARIHAEADMVRALGENAVDQAHAREIRARAFRQEIANSVEYVQAYWDRRSIWEAERLRRYVGPLERKEIQNSKTWERLKDHPDLNGQAIVTGQAHNFLLDRLSGSALASISLGKPATAALAGSKAFQLPKDTLHSLRLRQEVAGGQQLVFRADEGISSGIEWWPYLLRDEVFTRDRQAFDKARKKALASASTGGAAPSDFRGMLEAYDALERRFQARFPKEARLKSTATFQHYLTTQRFLQSLGAEIIRLETTGTLAGADDLKFTGDNLLELLVHMSRRGLDFAPAQPGEEAAYHGVFRLMRDLYITVAEEDGGTKSKRKS